MKAKLLLLSTALFYFVCGHTQAPSSFNYQGIARNQQGNVLQSQQVALRFTIHDRSTSGTVVYQEISATTTNQFGLFTTVIGSGTVSSGTFAAINWATGNKYLQVELDPTGGSSYTDMGTTQMVSVPYALYAQTSGSVTGAHYIGELYGGGIVVAIWKQGSAEHGLIASLSDLSTSQGWSNVISSSIGFQSGYDGHANTNITIAQNGHIASSALLCDNLVSNGYNDWYLPSVWELKQCYNVAFIVNTVLGLSNGFAFGTGASYWSSTENLAGTAYCVDFTTGNLLSAPKSDGYRVRAVRKF